MVDLNDILEARQAIAGKLHRTPMLSSSALGKKTGTELYFKAELFQKTGSFKPRGALNKLRQLTDEEKKRGVITISSGNHAQGLAYTSSMLGTPATVVMPAATPDHKVQAARAYGAEVILHGTAKDLAAKCEEVQKARNLTLVHPFDDPFVIAGQGTLGLEVLEDVPEPDYVFVAIGGGGLISGVATAIKGQRPQVKVIGVEPVGAPTMHRSLQQGTPAHLENIDTIAEGLAAPFVGRLNLEHVQKYVDDVVLVSDQELVEALRMILERCKVLTEPAGAAGFAALLFRKVGIPRGARVVCVLGGGNVDARRLRELL
jgi:threonine dehydratase